MSQPPANRKELEENMRQAGRLPPGQSLTEKFPVLHYGPIPPFDETAWNFSIWGEVEQPLSFTWSEFNQLPLTHVKMDLHCVTRWSKMDTEWQGVSLRSLIDAGLLTLKAGANFVIQLAENDFSSNLPLEVALADNFLLATHFQGQPLTPEHGFPLRGLVGAIAGRKDLKDVYLWKGTKWLRGLEFSSADRKGFWEMSGYHNDADVWNEERIAS